MSVCPRSEIHKSGALLSEGSAVLHQVAWYARRLANATRLLAPISSRKPKRRISVLNHGWPWVSRVFGGSVCRRGSVYVGFLREPTQNNRLRTRSEERRVGKEGKNWRARE